MRIKKLVLWGCLAGMLLLLFTGCGAKKADGFSEEELAEIHAQEQALTEAIQDITWHREDDKNEVTIFHGDGTYEMIYGDATWREYAQEDVTWEVKFCGILDAETTYMETDKEKALRYYQYNVVVHDKNANKQGQYTIQVETNEKGILLDYNQYVAGGDLIETMPSDTGVLEDLLHHAWLKEDSNEYFLFYMNGQAFTTHGVILNEIPDPFVYQWGWKDDMLYLMYYSQPEGKEMVEVVQTYRIEKEGEDYSLVNQWNEKKTKLLLVDNDNDSGTTLVDHYDQIFDESVSTASQIQN